MILDPTLTTAYIVVAAAVAFAPGPDFVYVVANAMRHQTKGALASALGVGVGSVAHALAAAVGVSALIAASPLAFDVLKFGGALYLAYLGIQSMRSFFNYSQDAVDSEQSAVLSPTRVFMRGVVTNILNPKVIIFYLALLPQFVNVELGNVGLQIFLLGCIHNILGLSFLIVAGLAAGRASRWMLQTGFGRWMDGIAGIFFLGLALRLVLLELMIR